MSLFDIDTCEERLMRVVTTRTMTITVSSRLDKPTNGNTLEEENFGAKAVARLKENLLNLLISFCEPSSAVVTGSVSSSLGSPVFDGF